MKVSIETIFNELDVLIKESNKLIIGVDGLGGSGKSTIAEKIRQINPNKIEVVHMDDFYFPTSMRYKNEDCNGVDIDRILKEVINPYLNNENVVYTKYDWVNDMLGEEIKVDKDKIILLEGVYSSHNKLKSHIDMKIWVECKRDIRLHRGLTRDGEAGYDNWVNVWMPLENKYVENQKPNLSAQYIVHTDVVGEEYKVERNT